MINNIKLPARWKEFELGEVCQIIGGKPAPQNDSAFSDEGVPFVRMQDLGKYHHTLNLIETRDRISIEYAQKNGFSIVKKGAILIPRSGSVSLNHRAILGVDAFIVSHICALKVKSPQIDNKFLYYLLRIYDMRKIMTKTTGLDAVSFENLRKIKLRFPPRPTQKRIVSILETAEETMHLREQGNILSKYYANNLFLDMFGDPIKNNKKWDVKPIGEIGEVKTGNTPSRKVPQYYGNYIEWIKSDNLNTPHTFATKSVEMLSEKGAEVGRTAPKGSILVTCIAGSLSCIGNAAIVDREVAFNQQINAIIPKKGVNSYFVFYLISNSKGYIQRFSTQSMKGLLSKSRFENIPVIAPPEEHQNKFGQIAEKAEAIRVEQEESKQEIENLFNALMHKAFTGELVA